MPIKFKKGGAYADILGVKVKRNGVYAAVVGAFVKTGGTYQSVLGAPSNIVNLTQAQSPYTLQASDSGKTIVPAPTAEFQIVVPGAGTLPANFTCTVAPTGAFYPVEVVKAGTNAPSVKNAGWEIDNANNMADRFLMAGSTGTIAATSADTFVLTGTAWRRFLNVMNRVGYSDSATNVLLQAMGIITPELVGIDGDVLYGIKIVTLNTAGFTESVPDVQTQFAYVVESVAGGPIGDRQRVTWGGVDTLTCPAGAKAEFISDWLMLKTPVVVNNANPAKLRFISWNTAASGGTYGAQTGKGNGLIAHGELVATAAATGTSLQNYFTLAMPVSNPSINNTTQGSVSIFRPHAIIGLMKSGCTMILMDSRAEPSNGDTPTPGGSPFAGEGERVHGRFNKPMLNMACANAGVQHLLDTTWGSLRRGIARFASDIVVNGFQNDLNVYTTPAILNTRMGQLKASPTFVGKRLTVQTGSPFTLSTDGFTTVSGQTIPSGANGAANAKTVVDLNDALIAGTITNVDRVVNLRTLTSTLQTSVLEVWNPAPGARTVTDLVTTVGSNIVTSPTAAFTPADDGYKMAIVNYNSLGTSVPVVLRMTYISPTQVSLFGTQSGTASNAAQALAAGTAYIRAYHLTTDGTHGSKEYGKYVEDNCAALIPA